MPHNVSGSLSGGIMPHRSSQARRRNSASSAGAAGETLARAHSSARRASILAAISASEGGAAQAGRTRHGITTSRASKRMGPSPIHSLAVATQHCCMLWSCHNATK